MSHRVRVMEGDEMVFRSGTMIVAECGKRTADRITAKIVEAMAKKYSELGRPLTGEESDAVWEANQ